MAGYIVGKTEDVFSGPDKKGIVLAIEIPQGTKALFLGGLDHYSPEKEETSNSGFTLKMTRQSVLKE